MVMASELNILEDDLETQVVVASQNQQIEGAPYALIVPYT